jgi:Protein of unknown function (DUF3095)
MTPVSEIRKAGRDVRVARFAASPHCSYAMFDGGGLAWFEGQVKGGSETLAPAAPGARPDLSGLSCRWTIARATHGVILSLIVVPRGDSAAFSALVEEVVQTALSAADGARPITQATLGAGWPGGAIAMEAAASAKPGSARLKYRLVTTTKFLVSLALRKLKLKTRNFDAFAYSNDVIANADFRKFDDGLRMTLDCSPEFADALEARLEAASGIATYGAFRQDNALLTCFVPSTADRGHVHFVDGADGGYTMAAKALKALKAR